MTVAVFLDFLLSYLDLISPLFGSALFAVPVFIWLTLSGIALIKNLLLGGFHDV